MGAQLDITPPAGTAMTGYILRKGPSVGLQDLLRARALMFDDGKRGQPSSRPWCVDTVVTDSRTIVQPGQMSR